MQIFIAYSSKDDIEAFNVCKYLEENGKKCFIAPRNIQPGKEYGEEIVNGIDESKAMILILSNSSNQSPHVLREVERAVSKRIPIYVYCLEKVELTKSMEYFLMAHQWGSLDTKDNYVKLLDWVNSIENGQDVCLNREQTETMEKSSIGVKFAGVVIGLLLVLLLCVGVFVVGNRKNEMITVDVGDSIILGTYNEEPIEWKVLKVNDGQAVLVAKNILTMKAFDAAESGRYNYIGEKDYWKETLSDELNLQVLVRGNSDWGASNIRTWLNSSEKEVLYNDQKPQDSAMAEYRNGYDSEAGFLYSFTEEELSAILETEVVTNANGLMEEKTIITTDKVFLLSREELKWFEEAGISVFTVPTQRAIEQDMSKWYEVDRNAYGVEEYYWWLREPVADSASKCYMVGNGYWEEEIREHIVGLEGFGIRPAITVDLSSDFLCERYGN